MAVHPLITGMNLLFRFRGVLVNEERVLKSSLLEIAAAYILRNGASAVLVVFKGRDFVLGGLVEEERLCEFFHFLRLLLTKVRRSAGSAASLHVHSPLAPHIQHQWIAH